MKLSISLNKPNPVKSTPVPRPSIFTDKLDDEAQSDEKTISYAVKQSKAVQKRLAAQKQVDRTVFDYDEVWDSMQEAKRRQQAAKEVDATARKPKYINDFLSSAATRKLDYLRAEEKLMQREREAEGDLYQDKESFVTQAYKDQMEQVRKAEEEEKVREEQRKKKGFQSTGMTHFYRQLLEESAQKHEATVTATEKRFIGPSMPGTNLTIVKPVNHAPLADAELARMAQEQGKSVELNDDNQIVDKRDLLSPGLNLSLPNTRRLDIRKPTNKAEDPSTQFFKVNRAVGIAASRKEINERRAREVQLQFEEEAKKVEQLNKEAEEMAVMRTLQKRNNESDVENARARYQERKRRKQEETREKER